MALDKSFQCNMCKKKFLTLKSLNQHKKSAGHAKIDTKGDFLCPTCNKKFQSKKALAQHLQTTITKRKPFQCKLCQKRFKTELALKQHTGKCKQEPKKRNFAKKKNKREIDCSFTRRFF